MIKRQFLRLGVIALFSALILIGITHQVTAQNVPAPIQQTWDLHQHDRPVASPQLEIASTDAVKGEWVNYAKIGDKTIKGYLARSPQAKTNAPALLVFHEWWGLNDNIQKMTEKLAAEGYTALAVDLYEGQVADKPEDAMTFMKKASQNQKNFDSNVEQAYDYLKTKTKAGKIGTIGWCFGGTSSLNTALLLPKKIDATVIYYGSGIESDRNKLKVLEMPILGIFAELDQSIPVAKVKQFEQTLKSLGKSVEIDIYPNADHAFANPSGTRYNATAAEDAWKKTIAFLKKNLQQ
jgi:carboxymethylenebutenolidase